MCSAHRSVWVLASSGLHHDHLPCERLTQYRTDRIDTRSRKARRSSGYRVQQDKKSKKRKEEKKGTDKISRRPESNAKGREIIGEEARTSCKD